MNYSQTSLFPLSKQPLNIVPKTPEVSVLHGAVSKKDVPTLYHGSPSVIKRGSAVKSGGEWSKSDAHATSAPITAVDYAIGRSSVRGDRGQMALWSVLHKVEPVKGKTVSKDISEHGKTLNAYVSKQFKSNGPIALIDNTTGAVSPTGKERIPGLGALGAPMVRPSKVAPYQPALPLKFPGQPSTGA